ncbi:hypothetical protein FCL47_07955 [Desulfopila sp. IMCC35006]|uniref:hypothetical protein n=1 Tax=Desulfopila sp. IMCC35006 TaxID=2569542 RepID=UPI0010ACA77B|nr:hypothetical protein [Desulfopila sp. IMCC35006]TKB27103.1 hypothetical protein FCL47_07955 [Desulfopila sp. IMCC35006]
MKNNTETISEGIFTHFPSSNTKSYTRTDCRRNQGALFSTPLRGITTWKQLLFWPKNESTIGKALRNRVLAYRNYLQSGVAALGIGTIFFITVYLFLAQLAEYGWQ